MQTEAVRRRTNGSIDYDFYRERAATERRAAIRDVALALRDVVKRLGEASVAGSRSPVETTR